MCDACSIISVLTQWGATLSNKTKKERWRRPRVQETNLHDQPPRPAQLRSHRSPSLLCVTTITDSDSDLGLDFEKQAGLVTSPPVEAGRHGGAIFVSCIGPGYRTVRSDLGTGSERLVGAHVTPSRLPSLFGIRYDILSYLTHDLGVLCFTKISLSTNWPRCPQTTLPSGRTDDGTGFTFTRSADAKGADLGHLDAEQRRRF